MAKINHKKFNLDLQNDIIIGIDQSLTHTGFTIIKENNNNQYSILASNGISTGAEDEYSIEERIFFITKSIENNIRKYKPGEVAIEGLAYNMNTSNNGRILAGIFFNLLSLFQELGIQYHIINIKVLKKFATETGVATKLEMREAISEEVLLNLEEKSKLRRKSKKFEDIVDSYWLALYLNKAKNILRLS